MYTVLAVAEGDMDKKLLHDICAYLRFLEQNGFVIEFYKCDALFESCAELTPYIAVKQPSGKNDSSAFVHADKQIVANVCICHREETQKMQCDAVLAPLVYMLEQWYAACDVNQHLSPIMQACHKAVALIESDYKKDISVNLLAKELGYSASYFGYFFKKMKGVSIGRYIMDIRLERSVELLDSQLSVAAIAEKVGFEDANYFSCAFKNKYGISPREYRKTKASS